MMESKAIDVAEQLRTAVEECGMTGLELAARSGVNQGQLSRFVRRQRDLNLTTVAKLCKVLGLALVEVEALGDGARAIIEAAEGKAKPGRPRKA